MNTFKDGQKVRIKWGTIDPDFGYSFDVDMIGFVDAVNKDLIMIAYTKETLAHMSDDYVQECDDLGVDSGFCVYHYTDLELINE